MTRREYWLTYRVRSGVVHLPTRRDHLQPGGGECAGKAVGRTDLVLSLWLPAFLLALLLIVSFGFGVVAL